MAYRVFLFNGLGISSQMSRVTLSGDQLITIARTLKEYFDKVVQAHDGMHIRGSPQLGNSEVIWLSWNPGATGLPSNQTIAPTELLIYLLPTGATVVNSGRIGAGNPPADHDGLTNPNLPGGTGSEVYAHFFDAKLLANLMFHEAMHNKLRLGNRALHSRGGLGDGPEGGTGPISSTTPLTQRNITDMAAALDRNQPQWIPGVALLSTEAMRSDNDPAKGLFP